LFANKTLGYNVYEQNYKFNTDIGANYNMFIGMSNYKGSSLETYKIGFGIKMLKQFSDVDYITEPENLTIGVKEFKYSSSGNKETNIETNISSTNSEMAFLLQTQLASGPVISGGTVSDVVTNFGANATVMTTNVDAYKQFLPTYSDFGQSSKLDLTKDSVINNYSADKSGAVKMLFSYLCAISNAASISALLIFDNVYAKHVTTGADGSTLRLEFDLINQVSVGEIAN
jgi:hypothetical protein